MASKVEIVNSGLRKINNTTITAFNQGTKAANVASDLYDILRQDLLSAHPWNFAKKREKLAQTTDVPASRFDHEYQLPTDWLRTVKVSDNDQSTTGVDYQVEGGKILSNADDIYLVYVRNVEDPNQMTAEFRETLSFRLAVDFAIALGNSRTLSEYLHIRFKEQFRKARSTDTMGDQPPRMPKGTWSRARFGGVFGGFFDPR